jgi:hypothetical protein
MDRRKKILLLCLPLALLLTAACRFIDHTDREYAHWIAVYRDIAAHLDRQCARRKLSEVCARAQERRAFLASLETYREGVVVWWWPAVGAASAAWIAITAVLIALARGHFSRREKP